jgi:short-subunit dehydrogenase
MGMGRNIACALAVEGVDGVLFARGASKLQEVAEEIERDYRMKTMAVPGDMLCNRVQ